MKAVRTGIGKCGCGKTIEVYECEGFEGGIYGSPHKCTNPEIISVEWKKKKEDKVRE